MSESKSEREREWEREIERKEPSQAKTIKNSLRYYLKTWAWATKSYTLRCVQIVCFYYSLFSFGWNKRGERNKKKKGKINKLKLEIFPIISW